MLADHHSCACAHGQRCTCSLKKENLESVPENPVRPKGRLRANTDLRKPRLSATHSDPSMTHFANGHHKPIHRHNHTSQDCAPYKIPRPHSIHGSSSLAQKSVDDLPLTPASADQRSVFSDAFPGLQFENQRLVRSAHGSPGLRPVNRFDQLNLPSPLDLSYPAFNTSLTSSPVGEEYNTAYQNLDYVTANDEQPMLGPVPDQSFDWSARDLPLDGGSFASVYGQPPSYASLDQSHVSRPEMTTTSSADVSEIGDFAAQGIPSPGYTDGSPYVASPPENGTPPVQYTTNDGFSGISTTALSANFDALTPESFAPQTASPFDPNDLSIKPDPEAFTRHGITVQEAQKLAHPGFAVGGNNPIPMSQPAATPTSDPLWASAYIGADEDPGFPDMRSMHDQNWIS